MATQQTTCQLLSCGTNTEMDVEQLGNISTDLIWQPRHNYSITHELLAILINNSKIVIPNEVKENVNKGNSLWSTALAYHYKHNEHHNYNTTNDQVAQEIALDFFSSALLSCPFAGEVITKGKLKKAANDIKKWPNYMKSTNQVKNAVNLVKDILFGYYQVTDETMEEEIPSKPYNRDESKKRNISKGLLETYKTIFACIYDDNVLESDFIIKLIYHFSYCVDNETANHEWMYALLLLFTNSELGKWVTEIYYHKLLLVQFHDIAVNSKVESYVLTHEIALNHDNDKYIPFQLLAYTLKWYYDNDGTLKD